MARAGTLCCNATPSRIPIAETVAGWDSLGHLRLITAVEEAFGVRFQMERIPQLVSPSLLRSEIETLRSPRCAVRIHHIRRGNARRCRSRRADV